MIGLGIAGLAFLIYYIYKGNQPNYLPFEMQIPDQRRGAVSKNGPLERKNQNVMPNA